MNRFPILAIAWAALLVAGFAVVFTLGAPVASTADELDAALHPPAPVTQEVAAAAAATIVRIQYPTFANTAPETKLATDFGIDHWVVEYSDTSGPTPRGLRVSIVVDTGKVEVTTYP
ncbi:MAG TPA: hypothetical protein VES19_06300 [Candidatus Limnocylindrales bacterium]|nr:hypothetical protein [Candidatus Limnocylindrales bacterium]